MLHIEQEGIGWVLSPVKDRGRWSEIGIHAMENAFDHWYSNLLSLAVFWEDNKLSFNNLLAGLEMEKVKSS